MELTSVVRVSTKGQDTEGQIPANERWAHANGHVITRTVEIKASAYKFGSAFEAKLTEILADKPQGIVMRRLDRLSRQGIRRGLNTIHRIQSAGVKLFFADLGDAAEQDEMTLAAMLRAAYLESKTKADRTLDNHRVIASRGAWMGVPPFGYSVAGSGELNASLAVCDAEAKILTELFERCRDGASLSELESWACSLGYVRPTPKGQKTERAWCPKGAQLRKVLSHEPYKTGETTFTSTPRDDDGKPDESRRMTWTHKHPGIIAADLYDAANAAKGSRRNRDVYTRDSTLEALEGAVTCSKCGGRLYLATQHKNGRDYVRYQCRKGHGMRKDKAEAYVDSIMHGHIMVQSTATLPLTADPVATELDTLRKELARCNAATDEGFNRIVELRARIAELDSSTSTDMPVPTVTFVDVTMYATSTWEKRRALVRKAGIKI